MDAVNLGDDAKGWAGHLATRARVDAGGVRGSCPLGYRLREHLCATPLWASRMQLCTGCSAVPLLNFRHMGRRASNNMPFLVGLAIEPENPWLTGVHRRRAKGKSGLLTLELCAGAGGQAFGLERAGIDHVGLVEIDKRACATLRQNRSKWNVIEHDLNTFDAAAFAGADIVSAGLPCPPFSVAGKQLGTLDERNLFPSLIRVVDQVRPRAVMVENVRGILGAVFEDYRESSAR
jgi:hypothetical protein